MYGRYVLIDGYNVIRSDPVLSNLEQQSMEHARDALARSVASSSRFAGDRVTIVFDGRSGRSFTSMRRVGGVEVSYPPPGTSADDLIKELATKASSPSTVVVVTNDGDIRRFCQALGCTVTASENLLTQISAPRRVRPRPDVMADTGEGEPARLGSEKKGNPRRLGKKDRRKQEYRF